jgi:hypothetical protein
MFMLQRFLLLVVLTTFSITISEAMLGTVRKASPSQANVSWLFDIRNDKYGNPRGKVFLLVGGRKVLILPKAAAQYRVLDRKEYESRDVPATAITACTGWWAGQGEDMYVTRRKKQLVVSIRYLDEGGSIPAYKRLKVIPLP